MKDFFLSGIRLADEALNKLEELKDLLEKRINLEKYFDDTKPVAITNNLIQRLALIAGLTLNYKRDYKLVENEDMILKTKLHDTVFSKNNFMPLWTALLKIRYKEFDIDWETSAIQSRIISYEIIKGAEHLLKNNNLSDWLLNSEIPLGLTSKGQIPRLNLQIGVFEGDLPAKLDLNGKNVLNTQILISGSTGSGKTNLLALIVNEIRKTSVETNYPVNFLLFDYKGEFSDLENRAWLDLFEVKSSALLDPTRAPLPFSPFKNFTGKPQTELNLYATELADALKSIDRTSISSTMSDRLTKAVINAYAKNNNLPITFESIYNEYTKLQPEKEKDNSDTIKATLSQLFRNKIFSDTDNSDLINSCYIVKMDGFPKDGPLAKAIVYFTISKLNSIYEELPKQLTNNECVQIRHFTIIDEAHYMLDFENRPLRNLIAVGRNKGLSIILATQSMDSYKSEHFDFFANAQYPLIMKQQSINDKVIKDIFGVSGSEFNEIKEAISSLQKGEVIIKDSKAKELGLGKKYKKIKTTHLI
jgi:type IV secretory pathway VirB4 component